MKLSTLTLALMACIGAGCSNLATVATSDLPNCLASNYDAQGTVFTIRNADAGTANQQCLLAVGPSNDASHLAAGSYTITVADGGGGGAGGGQTGGGGGGAGARELQRTVNLAEGTYKLTIGAGGPGGNACADFRTVTFPGGPGWAGSPSNIVRVATGEVILGTPGADTYARPSRGENERLSGKQDGHGGSGPGQATGGDGGSAATVNAKKEWAEAGASTLATGRTGVGGEAGVPPKDISGSAGGGGGATSRGAGGAGGGETARDMNIASVRGSLGSGGGGGGNCDPGSRGGHGYIILRRN